MALMNNEEQNAHSDSDAVRIKQAVSQHYVARVSVSADASSHEDTCCPEDSRHHHARKLGYDSEELDGIPTDAAQHAFGCGTPLAYAELKEGDIVLDLGSGAGIDVLLAAKKVGVSGKVIGLDMTPEMNQRAQSNAEEAGVRNVEFRLGEMEAMPVTDTSIDLVISNCVINLSPDKPQVLREAFRVLRPGGVMLGFFAYPPEKVHSRDQLSWEEVVSLR